MARKVCWLLQAATACVAASAAAPGPAPPSLGPGYGAWVVESPEVVGLTQEQADLIAHRVQLAGPIRYCLLLSVDGHLVKEVYYHNSSEARYEADSLAKSMIAQVIGVAVAKGLVDLDKPLKDHGVTPVCWVDEYQSQAAANPAFRPRPRRRPNSANTPSHVAVTPRCAEQLRQLCPTVAPPFDCLRPHFPGEVYPPPQVPKPPSTVCSDRCLKDPHVQSELKRTGCTSESVSWCQLPPGDDGCWTDCVTGEPYWPKVTPRSLLAQSGGYGYYAPGTEFTYDSNMYIDHLAYLISTVTNESSLAWATREYAAPLGLPPDIFAYDEFGIDFSAGGGQMMSCRDTLRVAQLLINKGRWADDDGGAAALAAGAERPWKQLLSEEFVESMMRPNFPKAFTGYGLLGWLNAPADDAHCCAPRWGGMSYVDKCGVPTANRSAYEAACAVETCREQILHDHIIGDGTGTTQIAPSDLFLAMGQSAKYFMAVPSQGMAAVSLGLSWGSSQQCLLGHVDLGGKRVKNGTVLPAGVSTNAGGYDDGFVAGTIWRAIGNISSLRAAAATRPLAAAAAPRPAAAPPRAAPAAPAASAAATSGSCYCTCPPGMGFGACFDMPVGTPQGSCSSVRSRAADVCPSHGNPRQCASPPTASDTDCSSVRIGSMDCHLSTPCQSLPGGGAHGLPIEEPHMQFATCTCQPTVFEGGACSWDDNPCQFSPFFPPTAAGTDAQQSMVI